MVGKDGVVGAFAALGGNIPVNRGIVQLAGPALTCKVSELRSAVLQSQSLLSTLFRHEQTVYAQASQSAACMAAHHVEARLCRWLLRSRDLAGSDNLQFTQEFLAEMLGVKRTRACCFLSESGFPALRLSDSSILLGPEASMDDPTAFGRYS